MWYVYIIRSISSPNKEHTGLSADLKQRFKDHNSGKSTHTAKYLPWELVWYCAFAEKQLALDFEKYLKSHSGRVFAAKRLVGNITEAKKSASQLAALGGSDPDAGAAPRRRPKLE